MFTGLIQAMGEVLEFGPAPAGARLLVCPGAWAHAAQPGESIAVSGVCLTHAPGPGSTGGSLAFDVVPETLARTTLGRLIRGARVNLEHSARADTLLGGHIVQGHVDGVGDVVGVERAGGQWRVRIAPPVELMPCIVEKGSIAVEGVSLTLAAVGPGWFEVALIPETLARTTLGALDRGAAVNIETDIIARTVVSYLERFGAGELGRSVPGQ